MKANNETWWKWMRRAVMAGVAAIAIPAWAHHSTAAYDYTKSVPMEGTVKEFLWTNPHMFIEVMVPDAQGKLTEWNIECGTPNINVRHGWKKTDIKPGDKVSVVIRPMRDGTTAGTLVTVKLPDGRTLFGPGGDIGAPPAGGPPAGPGGPGAPNGPNQ